MALEKTFSQEYPALDVIKDAMKAPNDWEGRHTDIGNGEWFPFTSWRHWGTGRLIGAKLRRVYTTPKPVGDTPISYAELLALNIPFGADWLARPPGGDWHSCAHWCDWSGSFRTSCEWKRATPAQPTEAETLRGEIAALTAALEQERENRKELERENSKLTLDVADAVERVQELEARAERISDTGVRFASKDIDIVHAFHLNILSSTIPRGTYRVLLERVGE